MSWDLNIPKIMHLYWGRNKPLSYMKYLTALSFSKLNPDWEIRCYTPKKSVSGDLWKDPEQKAYKYKGPDYFKKLKKIPNLKIYKEDFSKIGIPKDIPEVHRSDLLRLYLLKEYGGLWSDFDILYINPMDRFFANVVASGLRENEEQANVYVCYNTRDRYHSIGFLLGQKEVDYSFYGDLFNRGISLKSSDKYQGFGRHLLERYFIYEPIIVKLFKKSKKVRVANIPMSIVYLINWELIGRIYSGPTFNFPKSSIGIHWYAGSPISSKYENTMTEKNIDKSMPIYPYIEKIL